MRPLRLLLVLVFALLACGGETSQAAPEATPSSSGATMAFSVQSPSFTSAIPARHTCQGGDVAPALRWADPPAGTKSFALIVDDPDAPDPAAPKMTWVHWVIYDLPASTTALPEGGALPAGTRLGKNDWKATGYRGPCPPIGRHRYFFKVYALDALLGDLGEPSKAALEAAMAGHVLSKAELVGTYQKG